MRSSNRYRLTADRLFETLENWDSLLKFRVHLIGCGGTALTLLDIKESTKDIDFIVPIQNEYDRFVGFLKAIGYKDRGGGLAHGHDPYFIYQLYGGKRVFTTELLDSPLREGKHTQIKRYRHIYLGVLNLVDLIITKMFRGTRADVDDCVAAFSTGGVKPEELLERYSETALYDLQTQEMMKNLLVLAEALVSRRLVPDEFLEKIRLKL